MPDSLEQFKKTEGERQKKLSELETKSREQIVKTRAGKFKIPYADIVGQVINLGALAVIPEEDARAAKIAAYQMVEKKVFIAMANPQNKQAQAILKRLGAKYQLEISLVSERSLEWIFLNYKKLPKKEISGAGSVTIDTKGLLELQNKLKTLGDIKNELGKLSAKNIGESLEMILAASLGIEASDIHIEPTAKASKIQLRIDGLIQEIAATDRKVYEFLINRIKLISRLHLNIKDAPQDGRFTIHTPEADIEIRTSVLPGPNGENAVLRILNPKTISLELKDLGLQPFHIDIIQKELAAPNGMILVTGPTGSGKTTTLYAFLKKKSQEPGLKIITIEDPIEYHLESIRKRIQLCKRFKGNFKAGSGCNFGR
jgi:type II secretory ATPase GspE/PulE/Tfp pilus assembly ATPase PilB-like protein